jgi:hypothetical protein
MSDQRKNNNIFFYREGAAGRLRRNPMSLATCHIIIILLCLPNSCSSYIVALFLIDILSFHGQGLAAFALIKYNNIMRTLRFDLFNVLGG